MKNIIYISLIISLLASCKSSSFLKQRYTHLGHSSSKTSTLAKTQTKKNSATAKTETTQNTNKESAKTEVASVEPVNQTPVETPQTEKVKTKKTSVEKLESLIAKADVLHLAPKTFVGVSKANVDAHQNSASHAMGVISKILKIIILILILAIVVAAAILVATLKAP